MKEFKIMTGKELLELAKDVQLGVSPIVGMHNTDTLPADTTIDTWIYDMEDLEKVIEVDKTYKVVIDEYYNTEDYWVPGGVLETIYHFSEIK